MTSSRTCSANRPQLAATVVETPTEAPTEAPEEEDEEDEDAGFDGLGDLFG